MTNVDMSKFPLLLQREIKNNEKHGYKLINIFEKQKNKYLLLFSIGQNIVIVDTNVADNTLFSSRISISPDIVKAIQALGNGMAQPCARWIIQRIVDVTGGEKDGV